MLYVRGMGQQGDKQKPAIPADSRKERLAAELRANLQRRKQQGRARRKGAMDEASGLPAAGSQKPS
jgi:hypothetical protein